MIENLRLSDVRNFVTCAIFETMSEAARSLGIAQPSLSESILRLEQDLGHKLFYRSRAGIHLTPEGRSVLDRAKAALAAIESLKDNSREPTKRERIVNVGCHPVVASYALPQALKELQRTVPELHVRLRHGLSRDVQGDVQVGRLDIGIVINPTRTPDVILKKLATDEFGVWKHKKVTSTSTLILDPELHQTQSILRKWKNHPQKWIETSSLELIARLAHAGVGYGVLPKRAVELVGLPLEHVREAPTYTDEIALLYRPEFGKLDFEKKVIAALAAALSN